jgi:hypothetical protein
MWVKTPTREDLQDSCLQLAEALESLDNDARRIDERIGCQG